MRAIHELVAVALGSILGGGLRLAVSSWPLLQASTFPWPTLIANLAGSFLMGLAADRLSRQRPDYGPLMAPFLLTGFCGGLTTFSIFSLESITLLDDGRPLAFLLYIGLTMTVAVAGAWAGMRLTTEQEQR